MGIFVTGRFKIQDIKSTIEKVKVKVRVNIHGLVYVSSATGLEPVTAAEQEKLDKEEAMETEAPAENGTAADSADKDLQKEVDQLFTASVPIYGKRKVGFSC